MLSANTRRLLGRIIFIDNNSFEHATPNRELTISPVISDITGVESNLSSQLTVDDDDETINESEIEEQDEEIEDDDRVVIVAPFENDAIDWNYVNVYLVDDGEEQPKTNNS